MRLLRMPFCRLNESRILGRYSGSNEELDAVIDELSAGEWRKGSYHVLKRNCNHFTETLARRLLGVGLPSWVNRSANVAAMFGLTTKGINYSITSVDGRLSPVRDAAKAASPPRADAPDDRPDDEARERERAMGRA